MPYEHWDANILVVAVTLLVVGAIRFMAGAMALTGFVKITCSASLFTCLEMTPFWRK
jgi:hypothetical protein